MDHELFWRPIVAILSFVILGNELVDAHATLLPTAVRKQLFLAAFGIFAGPVFLAATALTFVAFLFHDVNSMANLIIHLMPSMAMYNLRWHALALHQAYPTFFNRQYLQDMQHQDVSQEQQQHDHCLLGVPDPSAGELSFWNGLHQPSVARNAIVYFVLWIPYTTWMLLYGLKSPVYPEKEEEVAVDDKNNSDNDKSRRPLQQRQRQPKYDTVFHSLWRGGPCELVGSLLWKRPKHISQDQSARNDFEVRDFMVYMAGHAMACVTIVVGNISYVGGQRGHALMMRLATTLCAERGEQRYTYYVTAMYGQKLRRAYKEATAS